MQRWMRAGLGRSCCALGLLLVVSTTACSRCGPYPGEDAAPAASVSEGPRAPIAAPLSLVARFRVAAPAALWRRAQSSSRLNLLPHRFALAVSTLLGLSPLAGSEIDESVPVHGVLLEQDGKLNLALAIGLKSGSAFLATVTTGNTGYRAAKDRTTGFSEILSESRDEGLRRGVYGNHLVVGSRLAALGSIAPYLVREVPGQAWPGSELALLADARGINVLATTLHAALDDLVRAAKASADEMQQRMGRAADYGDPAVVLGTLSELSSAVPRLLGTMAEGAFTADETPHGWDLALRVTPARGSEAEAFLQGFRSVDPSLLTNLPRMTDLALVVDAPLAVRQSWSTLLAEKAARAFGSRLSEKDHAALRGGLLSWDKARGDQAAWGWSSQPRGFILLTALGSSAEPEKALRGLTLALRGPLGAGPLGQTFGTIYVRPTPFVLASGSAPSKALGSSLNNTPDLEVPIDRKTEGEQKRALTVEWQVTEAHAAQAQAPVLSAALGERPREVMQSWLAEQLKDEPEVVQALEGIERASAVLLVHRRALKGLFDISASSSCVVTLGVTEGALRIRVRADDEVVSALGASGAR